MKNIFSGFLSAVSSVLSVFVPKPQLSIREQLEAHAEYPALVEALDVYAGRIQWAQQHELGSHVTWDFLGNEVLRGSPIVTLVAAQLLDVTAAISVLAHEIGHLLDHEQNFTSGGSMLRQLHNPLAQHSLLLTEMNAWTLGATLLSTSSLRRLSSRPFATSAWAPTSLSELTDLRCYSATSLTLSP